MSLPNYLAKIKSAGMYRFTFDKSQLPPAAAETMRLVVGYSDKGPFNNPVYIENRQDFITLFGNVNKKLERKGVFFHRMALQALASGPIIALNLKPFDATTGDDETMECVRYVSFDPCDFTINGFEKDSSNASANHLYDSMSVRDLFDRDRFWKIDADQLPYKIHKDNETAGSGSNAQKNKYINIAATDSLERSCSFFFRKCHENTVKEYNISVRDWYKLLGESIPEYLEGYEDTLIKDYFAEIYVFRGKFTDGLTGNMANNATITKENAEKCILAPYFNRQGELNTGYTNTFGENVDALEALAADANSNFLGVYRGCLLPYFKDQLGSYVSLDMLFNTDKDVHKMIMKLDDSLIESVILHYTTGTAPAPGEGKYNGLNHWAGTTNGTENTTNLAGITGGWSIEDPDINLALKPTYVEGYTYNSISKASNAATVCTKSLHVLTDKGIYTALTNHVDSEFHYIIDTYAPQMGTVTIGDESVSAANAKNYIAAIAKAKDNCLAILNAPARLDLIKAVEGTSTDTKFSLDAFAKGNYAAYFKLPTEADGASYCAYYTPLVFGDGPAKTVVPSAAIVSNNFMEKWKSRQPYYIVAGPTHGRMDYDGLIGPDYNYSREDLDVYEPMGINCMVYIPRKGTYINSNQTAKQVPVTALSKVHVRELVIYLQNEIENMMQNYQWELNTQTLRDTIKTKADAILEKVKNNGGVYDYLNVCDGSNNTADVIDNEMIILDTSIEPARGAGKMVQRLTIHKTGGISSLTK